jgi:hypothetical protein
MIMEVDRSDLRRTRHIDTPAVELADGDARLRVAAFGLTANNITYGAVGDAMQYWNFFPAEPGWGRIPVWGFADVAESRSPSLAQGKRVYGYFPMADELIVTPGKAHAHSFTDTAPHRQAMASAYNRYLFTDQDAMYDATREAQQMLLVPLFFTSFMLDDYIADNECFGASTIVISSASSKTAIGTAYMLHRRPDVTVIGLTSDGNRSFVKNLGCYHEVRTYDEVATLPGRRSVYVDVAGNNALQAAVHRQFGELLNASVIVGDTHWDAPPAAETPVGPAPGFFFAPTQIAKRVDEWGQAEVDRRVSAAYREFSRWTDRWLDVRRSAGPDAVEATYQELVNGRVDPRVGHVCTMLA